MAVRPSLGKQRRELGGEPSRPSLHNQGDPRCRPAFLGSLQSVSSGTEIMRGASLIGMAVLPAVLSTICGAAISSATIRS